MMIIRLLRCSPAEPGAIPVLVARPRHQRHRLPAECAQQIAKLDNHQGGHGVLGLGLEARKPTRSGRRDKRTRGVGSWWALQPDRCSPIFAVWGLNLPKRITKGYSWQHSCYCPCLP